MLLALRRCGPRLGPVAPARLTRALCSAGRDPPSTTGWNPDLAVHGRPPTPQESQFAAEASGSDRVRSTAKAQGARQGLGSGRAGDGADHNERVAFRANLRSDMLTPAARADLLQFQVYVRQRLGELNQRLPPRMALRERAELAFLEEEVIQDHMNRRRRQLRDPLKDVPLKDIRHTNLNLLSRFVSESGAILPRKLTGVKPRKQRRIARMLKRSHQLALLPKTWKHPKFRHASYADQFSQPERNPQVQDDEEFRDPADIRFPNQWEDKRPKFEYNLSSLMRNAPRSGT